jgi:hypothetical protein
VTCEDNDFVAALLQSDGGIYHEPLGTANSQVGVQEDYRLPLLLLLVVASFGHGGRRVSVTAGAG